MDAQAAKRDAPPLPDDPALVELRRRHRVRRLDLIGSATTGAFEPARSVPSKLVHRPRPSGNTVKNPQFSQAGDSEQRLF